MDIIGKMIRVSRSPSVTTLRSGVLLYILCQSTYGNDGFAIHNDDSNLETTKEPHRFCLIPERNRQRQEKIKIKCCRNHIVVNKLNLASVPDPFHGLTSLLNVMFYRSHHPPSSLANSAIFLSSIL